MFGTAVETNRTGEGSEAFRSAEVTQLEARGSAMIRFLPAVVLFGFVAAASAQEKKEAKKEDPNQEVKFVFLKDMSVTELKVPQKGKASTFKYVVLGASTVEWKPLVKAGEKVEVVMGVYESDKPGAKLREFAIPPRGRMSWGSPGERAFVGRGEKDENKAMLAGESMKNISITVLLSRSDNDEVKLVVIPAFVKGK